LPYRPFGLCAGHGARVVAGCAVASVIRQRDRVVGIRTADGRVTAGTVVLAAGSWSGFLGEGLGLRIPVSPAK